MCGLSKKEQNVGDVFSRFSIMITFESVQKNVSKLEILGHCIIYN